MKNLPAIKVKTCWHSARWHYWPEAKQWGITIHADGKPRYWTIYRLVFKYPGDKPTGYYLREVTNGGGKFVPVGENKPFRTLRDAQEASYAHFATLYEVEFIGGDQYGFMPGEEIKPWYGKRK